jgi:Kef-type K+ transport system membrane component KefB
MELIAIGLVIAVYLFGLVYSIWKVFRSSGGRLYWIGCAGLLIVGTLGMIVAALAPPMDGEMPPQFGLAVWVVLLGLFGTAVPVAWGVSRRIFGRLTRSGKSRR